MTIKFSGREIKCHKIILCNGSKYFEALCSPASGKFAESSLNVIELHEDDPVALEVVLRFIYNWTWPEISIAMTAHGSFGLETQLKVLEAAQKYLMPNLETIVAYGVESEIKDLLSRDENGVDANAVMDTIELLIAHQDLSPKIGQYSVHLVMAHMGTLFKLKRFREMMETEEGAWALGQATMSMDWGSKVLNAVRWGVVHTEKFTRCTECSFQDQDVEQGFCRNCYGTCREREFVDVSRRAVDSDDED